MKKDPAPSILKKIQVLSGKQGSTKLSVLASEMSLNEDQTIDFLQKIFPVGIGVEIYEDGTDRWVDIKGDAIQYMLPLSSAEWIELNQVLSSVKDNHEPAWESLKKKVSENGPIRVVMDLLHHLESWDQDLINSQKPILQNIETCIEDKKLIDLKTRQEKRYLVYPCKILHLEGELSLIAEDSQDHCLMVLQLRDIDSFDVVNSVGRSRVSSFEVDEFITAVRAMNEKETRLILKIHHPESINLFPSHHFLGKPCMVTNPNGDLIWAAYVEPCEALYEWLLSIGKDVEVLDPIKFKKEYLDYCEEKLKKVA